MKTEVTEQIFAMKKKSGLSRQTIAEAVDMSEVWTTSTCLSYAFNKVTL